VQNLIGEHEMAVCSKCRYASAVKGGAKLHVHSRKKGSATEPTVTMFPDLILGVLMSDDPGHLLEWLPKMSTGELDEIRRVWMWKFAEMTTKLVRIRHPTHAESKRGTESQEVAVYVQETLLAPHERFSLCDFEAKEGATELCWHLLRKKIRQLYDMTKPLYEASRAITP
jgi:hypothetical protein